MARFVSLTASGIALGGAYALVALGFVIVYKATGILNFAQGSLVTLGAYLAVWLSVENHFGGGTVGTYLLVLAMMAAAGVFFERTIHLPLRRRPPLVVVIATLAAGLAIQYLLELWQSSSAIGLPPPFGDGVVHLGGGAIPYQDILVVAVTAVVFAGAGIVFQKTSYGRQLRAIADNPQVAALHGIRVRRMAVISFAAGAFVAGIAGLMIGPLLSVSPTLGFGAMIIGFAAAVLGGFGRLGGLLVGAVVMGLAQQWGAGYIAYEFQTMYPFIIMVLVIALLPRGLFGSEIGERV
jgi:branched-chain amino acid transport system permease protein